MADAAEKRVLCYGDSNTWGFIGLPDGGPTTRYARDQRWPGVLQAALGDGVEVIEEALNGRTTDVADPTNPQITGAGLDGAAYLPAALASHLPLDVVVIMLGSNDTKAVFARDPQRIALGAKRLLDVVRTLDGGIGTEYPNPRALLIAPPPLGRLIPYFQAMFAGGEARSRGLAEPYATVARLAGAAFLDAGTVIRTDGADGLHLSAESHRALGLAVAGKVRGLLG
jgi:lysophospholipase L1-like esterase